MAGRLPDDYLPAITFPTFDTLKKIFYDDVMTQLIRNYAI